MYTAHLAGEGCLVRRLLSEPANRRRLHAVVLSHALCTQGICFDPRQPPPTTSFRTSLQGTRDGAQSSGGGLCRAASVQGPGPSQTGNMAMALSAGDEDWWAPLMPCDMCRIWQLNCVFDRGLNKSCYPCTAFCTQCRLSSTSGVGSDDPRTADPSTEAGQLSPAIDHLTANGFDHNTHQAGRSRSSSAARPTTSRSRQRLTRLQTSILQNWARSNEEHPYPSEVEKNLLQQQTGLSQTQICNWFANHRRKRKAARREKPVIQQTNLQQAQPIEVSHQPWETLSPLQRWRESPPEAEPATFDAISAALQSAGISQRSDSDCGESIQSSHSGSYVGCVPEDAFLWMAPSAAERGSAVNVPSVASTDSLDSFNSAGSGWSDQQPRHPETPTVRPGTPRFKRRSRRKQRYAPQSQTARRFQTERRFQCTFCTDRFKTKFDWARHEKTLHLSLETWTCPGSSANEVQNLMSSQPRCVFCDSADRSAEHYAIHNPTACAPVFGELGARRVFSRKDHLQQHLRVAHSVDFVSATIQQQWKSDVTHLRSRCGFCDATFTTWEDRVTHLVQEFRNGAEMRDWKGSRGFDADVEAQAVLSMPPYLIDVDSKTQTPFSASDPMSIVHHTNLFPEQERRSPSRVGWETQADPPPNVLEAETYWEKIDSKLGQWFLARTREGISVTDEMIQEQGRVMVFGTADPWNQSEADHPDWLADFRAKYGSQQALDGTKSSFCSLPTEVPAFEMDPYINET